MASTETSQALLEELARSADPEAAIERKRMLLIVNPYAATVSDRLRNLVVYALQGRYEVSAIDTEGQGHATELCREAAHEGYDVVVAFGGDGTVNEAAAGLLGSETPLTCLPGGSANVYAKMLGIPGEIVDATEHLLRMADEWRPRRVRVGRVASAGRIFTFSAGVGLDADVVRRVDERPGLKARYGPWWFTAAAMSTFASRYLLRPPRLEVVAGDEQLRGVTAVVQNGDPYTYFNDRPVTAAEGERLTSSTLAGVVLERANPVDVPGIIWRLLSSARATGHGHISGFQGATEVEVRSADGRAVPLQVDGEYVGDIESATFCLDDRRLTVVS